MKIKLLQLVMQLNLIRAALGVDYLENLCNSSAKDNKL